jgi:hypothetical protein
MDVEIQRNQDKKEIPSGPFGLVYKILGRPTQSKQTNSGRFLGLLVLKIKIKK